MAKKENLSIFDEIRAQYKLILNKEAPEIERRGSKDIELHDWTPPSRVTQSVPNSPRSFKNHDSEFQRELTKFFISWYKPNFESNGNFKDPFPNNSDKHCGKVLEVGVRGETLFDTD